MLLSLASPYRQSELSRLQLDLMSEYQDRTVFILLGLAKSQRDGQPSRRYSYPHFSNQPLCPAATVKQYIAHTSSLRGKEQRLLLSLSGHMRLWPLALLPGGCWWSWRRQGSTLQSFVPTPLVLLQLRQLCNKGPGYPTSCKLLIGHRRLPLCNSTVMGFQAHLGRLWLALVRLCWLPPLSMRPLLPVASRSGAVWLCALFRVVASLMLVTIGTLLKLLSFFALLSWFHILLCCRWLGIALNIHWHISPSTRSAMTHSASNGTLWCGVGIVRGCEVRYDNVFPPTAFPLLLICLCRLRVLCMVADLVVE